MPTEGVDYSFDKPDVGGLAAVGKQFACRYVGPGSSGKLLTQAEANALADVGLSIVANAEGAAGGLSGGADVGRTWATKAHEHALRCGMPPSRPIYLSVDFDVRPAQWTAVREALVAAGEILGPERVGIYGSYDACTWALRDRCARWFWQTYAWSETRWVSFAHIRQYRNNVSLVGGTVDLDRAMRVDYGQWQPGALPPETGDGDMDLTQENLRDIAEAVRDILREEEEYQSAGVKAWATASGFHDVSHRTLAEYVWPTTAQTKEAVAELTDIVADVRSAVEALEAAPGVDPVALATALIANPDFAAQLANAITHRLGRVVGEVTLTGTADLGMRPPAP